MPTSGVDVSFIATNILNTYKSREVGHIYLSYNERDHSINIYVDLIKKHLFARFGTEKVFDCQDYKYRVEENLQDFSVFIGECSLLIAVLGNDYLNSGNQNQLEEIEIALKLAIPILPCLVDEAEAAFEEELPEGLKKLFKTEEFVFNDYSIVRDSENLIETAENLVPSSAENADNEVPLQQPLSIKRRIDPSPVFISYSHDDNSFVLQLGEQLKARGISVWLDQWEMSGGDPWSDKIDEALRQCSKMVFVMSPSSLKSEEAMSELHFVFDKKNQLYQ